MKKNISEDILRVSRERAPQFYSLTKSRTPSDIEIGQIWSTWSTLELPELPHTKTDEPRLLVILMGTGNSSAKLEQVTTAPISLQVSMATDFDLIVPLGESPLNYRFMIEVWNETTVVKAHFRQYLGKLSDNAIDALKAIYKARLLDEAIPAGLQNRVGLPLMGESDSRVNFQENEIEALEYLTQVAMAVAYADINSAETIVDGSTDILKHRFALVPRLGNVVDFLKGPKRALASSAPVGNEMIIAQSEGLMTFTFELLIRKRISLVYLIVHEVSANLEGLTCTVTLIMPETEIRSQPTVIYPNTEIEIGRLPAFNREKIQEVIVEIME